MANKVEILNLIEKTRWIEAVVHWAEFFLVLAVLSGTVDLAKDLSSATDLLYKFPAAIAEHGWLVFVLFLTRSTKSVLKIRRETLSTRLKWALEEKESSTASEEKSSPEK